MANPVRFTRLVLDSISAYDPMVNHARVHRRRGALGRNAIHLRLRAGDEVMVEHQDHHD